VGERDGTATIRMRGAAIERPVAGLARIYEQAIPRRMQSGVLSAAGT